MKLDYNYYYSDREIENLNKKNNNENQDEIIQDDDDYYSYHSQSDCDHEKNKNVYTENNEELVETNNIPIQNSNEEKIQISLNEMINENNLNDEFIGNESFSKSLDKTKKSQN